MPLIEGIGDEVVQFIIVVVLIAIATLAWQSTQIAELPLFRALVIVERQQPHPQAAASLPVSSAPPLDEEDKSESESSSNATTEPRVVEVEVVENDVHIATNEGQDGETCVRRRRLPFLQNVCENATNDETSSPSLTENIDATIEDVGDNNTGRGGTGSSTERTTPPRIRIRVKYLNDDLKLVEGKLEEPLGDFKKRHFSLELSERKLVRLIFNGQVLREDSLTLRHYGLFDNCVVHCLVHVTNPPQPPPLNTNHNARATPQNASATRNSTPTSATISSWIVRNGILASLSVMLGLAWYGRIQYAQLYNATSTVALVGLTAIFTVSIMAIYRTGPEDTPLR